MIQELLRSTLIVGTVLVSAVQIGHLADRPEAAKPDVAPAIPIAQVSRQDTSPVTRTSPIAVGLLNLKSVEGRLEKIKIRSVRSGLATWYGMVRNNHRTASGELFDCEKLTGASNLLPFGTRVKVTNLKNGRSVVVRVNDRGVLAPGHVIDVTSAAAERIGLLRMGVAPVHVDVLAAAF